MPDPVREPNPAADPSARDEAVSEVRYLPVPRSTGQEVQAAPVRPLERLRAEPLPATIVAATGGFLAGAASWVLVRVLRGGRRRAARLPGRRGRGKRVEVAGSRSFLVDVHLLKR